MTQEEDRAAILEAHQELVRRMEKGAGWMKALSAATIVVAVVLAVSYAYQLLLPSLGTRSVTVNLTDPANEAAEGLVLALALVWLFVGVRNFVFSSKIGRQVREARAKESELEKRISG